MASLEPYSAVRLRDLLRPHTRRLCLWLHRRHLLLRVPPHSTLTLESVFASLVQLLAQNASTEARGPRDMVSHWEAFLRDSSVVTRSRAYVGPPTAAAGAAAEAAQLPALHFAAPATMETQCSLSLYLQRAVWVTAASFELPAHVEQHNPWYQLIMHARAHPESVGQLPVVGRIAKLVRSFRDDTARWHMQTKVTAVPGRPGWYDAAGTLVNIDMVAGSIGQLHSECKQHLANLFHAVGWRSAEQQRILSLVGTQSLILRDTSSGARGHVCLCEWSENQWRDMNLPQAPAGNVVMETMLRHWTLFQQCVIPLMALTGGGQPRGAELGRVSHATGDDIAAPRQLCSMGGLAMFRLPIQK